MKVYDDMFWGDIIEKECIVGENSVLDIVPDEDFPETHVEVILDLGINGNRYDDDKEYSERYKTYIRKNSYWSSFSALKEHLIECWQREITQKTEQIQLLTNKDKF